MWVFLSDAFLSVVASDRDPGVFAVRARKRKDLLNAFPDCTPVKGGPRQDYAWRAFIPRETVEALLVERLRGLDYHNFKGSIDERTAEGEERHDAYLGVWNVMLRFQNGAFRSRFRGRRKGRWAGDL
jgi:hypothetical protein